MAAYTFKKDGFDLEIFRVDKPRGRWLVIGGHEAVPGWTCLRFMDKRPEGCTLMNSEAEPYRHTAAEALLRGEGLLFPKK